MSLLLELISPFIPYLAVASAAVIGVAVSFFTGKSAGKTEAKLNQMSSEQKARDISDEIDDVVAGRDSKTNRELLKRWSPKR